MRVILRNTATRLFYAGADGWTEAQSEAFDFGDTSRALDAVAGGNLGPVELLMSFEDPKFEIPLTIVNAGI
jgi:hypothetical protein